MRQVWLTKVGGPEVLQIREAPDPTPGGDEVRVRVRAAGVNFAEIMARKGLYPDAPKVPFVPGYEVSGVVDAVGERVRDLRVGDAVVAVTRFGGYADVVCAAEHHTFRIVPEVPLLEAAAIPVNYLTAELMLADMARVQAGETIFVHSLGGGVGIAMLQLARARGAHVTGSASTPKHARLREMGAAHVVDSGESDFEAAVIRFTNGAGVDAVFDPVAGKSFLKSYRCLRPFGRLIMYGASSLSSPSALKKGRALLETLAIPTVGFHPLRLMSDNRSVMGFNLGHLWDETDRLRAAMRRVGDGFAARTLAPVVDRTFPLDEAGAAHAWIEQRRNFGKVLLVP